MHHSTRLLPLVSLLVGCALQPDVVSEGLPTDSSPAPGASFTSAAASVSTATTTESFDSAPTAAPPAGAYGAPCELGLPHDVQSKAVTEQPACAGGICLFMFDGSSPECVDDSDCTGPYATCSDDPTPHCELDQAYVAEHSRCTQRCESDLDCPDIPGCAGAAACVPVAVLPQALCCERMCVCEDELSAGEAQLLTQLCMEQDACGS